MESSGKFEPLKAKSSKSDSNTSKAVINGNRMFSYADECNIIVDKDGKFFLEWNDGKALAATRGATIDYIASHFHIHLARDTFAYSAGDDYDAMIKGGVDGSLALIIVLMRQVVVGIDGIAVNGSETVYVDKIKDELALSAKVQANLKDYASAFSTMVQQSVSILALNGISLISRGHHYNEADQFWGRLDNATDMSTKMSDLKVADWAGAVYHDALHVFDYDKIASMVTFKTGGLETHVNGSVLKRLGTMPAGTTILGIIIQQIDTVNMYNAALGAKFANTRDALVNLTNKIRERPLDYCVHFKRSGVNERLANVGAFEAIAVFLHGYIRTVEAKKSTLTSAKSVENLAKRMQDMYVLGVTAAATYTKVELTAEEIQAKLGRIFEIALNAASKLDDDFEAAKKGSKKGEEL